VKLLADGLIGLAHKALSRIQAVKPSRNAEI
jgi:hypothetical protein